MKSGDVPVYATVILANGSLPAGQLVTVTIAKGQTLSVNASVL
jgi:hypothetical protein